jgi:hypothetical protein
MERLDQPHPPRPLTLVCHLLAEPAASGRVVGHVEVVTTGEVVAVTDVADLQALLVRVSDQQTSPR